MGYSINSEKKLFFKIFKNFLLILFLLIKIVLWTHLKTSSYFECLNV